MRIIGCGNRDRADDQAGILAAERLRHLGLETEIHTGDALALLDRWTSTDDVILIDVVVAGALAGTICVWELTPGKSGLPAIAGDAAVSSCDGFDIAKAIELASALGKLPKRLRIFGIEGARFDRGAALSPGSRECSGSSGGEDQGSDSQSIALADGPLR